MTTAFSPRFFLPTAPTDPYMDLTPEELAQERISSAYRSASERGPVAAMLAAAQAMKEHYPAQSEAAPEPATVSGGSVIGLMPEQTTALLDRVQRQNEIDRRMYEARQSDLRQQAQAREGYIFRARDAEANRQQRAAIEDARIKQKQAAEAEKLTRGTIDALPGQPGFGLQRRMNPDTGQMEASVVQLQGADALPEKPKTPHWVQAQGADGKVVFVDLNNLPENAPPVQPPDKSGPTEAQIRAQQNVHFKMLEGAKSEDGTALSDEERWLIARNMAETGEYPAGVVMKPATKRQYKTDPAGNIYDAETGEQVNDEFPGWTPKPTKDTNVDPIEYLRKNFGPKWYEAKGEAKSKQALGLASIGVSRDKIEELLGPTETDKNPLWPGATTNYTIPDTAPQAAAPAPTAAPQKGTDEKGPYTIEMLNGKPVKVRD